MDANKMDKFTAALQDSVFSAALLYNAGNRDFEWVRLERLSEAATEACLAARGLSFAGVVGIVNGEMRVALEMPLDVTPEMAQAFVQLVKDEINCRIPTGEDVQFLRRLLGVTDAPHKKFWNCPVIRAVA
jgi:hypothetical protein